MYNPSKTKQKIVEENTALKQRIKELEISEADLKMTIDGLMKNMTEYRMFLSESPDPIFVLGTEGQFKYANESFACEIGKPIKDIIEKNARDVFPLEEADKHLTALGQVLDTGVSKVIEVRVPRPDGDHYYITTLNPIKDSKGKTYSTFCLAKDITTLKQTEQALQNSEELYRTLIETSPDPIIMYDLHGKLIAANTQAVKIYGVSTSEELLKKVKTIFDLLTDEGQAAAKASLCKTLTDGTPERNEYFIKVINGKLHNAETHSSIVRTADGKPKAFISVIRDITDRKKTEEDLRKSEAYFRAITDNSSDLLYIANAQGNITYASTSVERITGYHQKEIIGKSIFYLVMPVDLPRITEEFAKALKTNNIGIPNSFCIRHKNGRELIMEGIGTNLLNDPLVAGFVMTARDITEREHAKEMLRESEEKFRKVFMTTPDCIAITRLQDGLIRDLNVGFEEATGWEIREAMGKTSLAINFWKDPADRMFLVNEMNAGRNIRNREFQFRKKDGMLRSGSYSAHTINISGEECIIFVLHDNTEQKNAEKVIRESERRFSDIIEFLPDATLVIDRDGKVIAWNRAIEKMTGIRKEAMLSKGNYEYAIPFYGERRPILIDYALQPNKDVERQYTAMQREGDLLFGEAFTPNLPPGDVHLSGTASVLRNEKGEIISAIECIRDDTERNRLEERLNRAEKMEALGQLAGGVAHDLNNILGILSGYSELLLMEIPEGQKARNHAERILQSTEKGAAIIQDLLTLARRSVATSKVINLNKIIADFLKTPVFEKIKDYHPHINFRTVYQEGLLNIKGSPVHLEKTIMNLVSNAAESISGEGIVTIQTENRYIDEPIRGYDEVKEGDYSILTIADTGTGIPDEHINKIFEPFYTKKTMGKSGTGLGLAIVWGTVKDHHGYIDVQTKIREGTTFTIYFPVTREEIISTEQNISLEQYHGQGEFVLVVDDIAEQREVASGLLTKFGYRVHTVSSGEEAIEYLRNNKTDILVLDMIMTPGIDGLETYQRVLEVNPKQKAILVSGFSETDRVRKAQQLGAGAYIKKPYMMEKIGIAIRDELKR